MVKSYGVSYWSCENYLFSFLHLAVAIDLLKLLLVIMQTNLESNANLIDIIVFVIHCHPILNFGTEIKNFSFNRKTILTV